MPKKYNGVKVLKVRKGATLREIYRAAKEQFTAADLARFCQDEPMIPAEQFLAEMEAIYEKEMRRYKTHKAKNQRTNQRQRSFVQKPSSSNHSSNRSRALKRHNGVRVLNVRKNATLKEIYRAAKDQFSAEDLARYCQIEPMIPAQKVMAELEVIYKKEMPHWEIDKRKEKESMHSSANGERSYRVGFSDLIRQELRRLVRRAVREGRGAQFHEALRIILSRLASNPKDLGEPLYRLANLHLQVRQVAVRPLVVDFAVHEDRPVVFIKTVALLPDK